MEPPRQPGEMAVSTAASAAVDVRGDLAAHISRELHDQVAQPLVTLILEIHQLRQAQHWNKSLEARMSHFEDSVRRVLRQTREMLVDLRGPQGIRLDFANTLRIELIRNVTDAEINIHASARWPAHINGWVAFNLLRIAQEAVTNAIRHGKASKIDIFLDANADDEAVMVLVDDGIGINDAPPGFGLAGMSERAVIIGGTFKVGTWDSGGTRVEVRVPLQQLSCSSSADRR